MNTTIKKELEKYPEISFIDDTTLEQLFTEMISDYETKYKEETGSALSLAKADPYRMILYAAALQIYQGLQYIDRAGKQSFLKYAYGDILDNLAALKKIKRNEGKKARLTMRFWVSEEQPNSIIIPNGTRVTAGDEYYFETIETVEVSSGTLFTDVVAECTEIGIQGNKYPIGKVTILADTIAFIDRVENITNSDGGADRETDTALADRIYLSPSSYSVAGPEDAYKYWAMTCNPNIGDVVISTPTPGCVDIRVMMRDGKIPEQNVIDELQEYLSNSSIRPLTDFVTVSTPTLVTCDINVDYWINESDRIRAGAIKKAVESAINTYQMWQQEKIGRDINPSQLEYLMMQAGAKRVQVNAPAFQAVDPVSLPKVTGSTISYRGLEDD